MLVSDMITKVRQRANLEMSDNIQDSDQFITDTEILAYLNEGGNELQQKLIDSGSDYFLKSVQFTLSSGSSYPLPSDFFKVRGVDKSINGQWISVEPFQFKERNKTHNGWAYYSALWINLVEYRIAPSTIEFIPESNGLGSYQLHYEPVWTELLSSDTFSLPNSWELYMVLYAALQCRIKENIGDTANLEGMLARKTREIVESSCSRGQPKKILNTRKSRW